MAKKFAEHNGLNLTQTNNDVLAAWEKNDIFHKSIDEREGCPQFIFYPPSLPPAGLHSRSCPPEVWSRLQAPGEKRSHCG